MPPDDPALALEDSDFFGDSGPEFSTDAAPEAPGIAAEYNDASAEIGGWTADGVAEFMRTIQAPAFNALLNPVLGVKEVDWSHREKRLEQVAPAIAREWNKIPRIRSLAGQTDRGLILSYLILEYLGPRTFDVVSERKAIAEAEAELEATAEQNFDWGEPIVPDDDDEPPRVSGLPPRRR